MLQQSNQNAANSDENSNVAPSGHPTCDGIVSTRRSTAFSGRSRKSHYVTGSSSGHLAL